MRFIAYSSFFLLYEIGYRCRKKQGIPPAPLFPEETGAPVMSIFFLPLLYDVTGAGFQGVIDVEETVAGGVVVNAETLSA